MSKVVDERVVSMQFDNRHFENNVRTTMSTLDKLKQKLHLDGATKGLENVNTAAKNVKMNNLGDAVENVRMRFSALEVMGVTALANITNQAVNAGKRMLSALTIDPVKTGFQEYETQINAVQTILANTSSKGTTIDDVNLALEELNKYADKTIYNFTEMTRNIGTFTAAGVDLDTATNAIQGIANLAAVSGSTSQQASTAMYQLSQALSSGTVKLMDWNSVVNAGMGGQVFQDALKETARVHGIAIDDMIKEQGSFRETLSEGWLSAEILTETLQKFTLTTEGLTEAEIEANRQMLRSKGYTEAQIEEIFKLGKTATDAATKVKTFTQLWDVLKEAAQSGWSQSWKLIVGDFEEAKALLTPLADTLTGFINKMSDARNRVLQIALDFASPWSAMMKKLGGSESLDKIKKVVKGVGDVTDKLKYYQDVVTAVWRGDYKNADTGRYELLEEAGYDHRVVQSLVNKGYLYKLTIEDIEAAHKRFGLSMETTTEETEEVAAAIGKLSDEQLKNAGLTDDEIALYRALESEAERAGISIEELADKMSKNNGRDMLIDSFKNMGDVVIGIGKAIKNAWVDIFNPPSLEVMGIRLYGLIDRFKAFTESIRLTDKETGKLNENGQKIQRIFKGIFAAVDIVLTILSGPFKIALNIVGQILKFFGLSVLDVGAFVGDAIVKFHDWFESIFDISGLLKVVVPWIKDAGKAIGDWFDKFKQSEGMKKAIEYIKGIGKGIKDWWAGLKDVEDLPRTLAEGIVNFFSNIPTVISTVFKHIRDAFTKGFGGLDASPITGFFAKIGNGLKIAGQTIVELGKILLEKLNGFLSAHGFREISEDSIAGLVNGLKDGASKVWNAAVEMAKNLVQKVKDFLGIHSPSKVFFAIGGFIIAGLIAGLQNGIPDSFGAFKDIFQPMLDWIGNLDFGAILASVIGVGSLATIYKAVDAISAFSAPFEGIGDILENTAEILDDLKKPIKNVVKSFAKIGNAVAFNMRMDGVKTLATSIVMLAAAVAVLSFIEPAKLWNAVGVIAVLSAVLIGLAFVMNKMGSATASIDWKKGIDIQGLTSGLVSIGIAILLLGLTVKMIGSLDPEQAKLGFLGLAGLVLSIVAVVAAFGLLVKGKAAENIDKFGKTMTKLSIALLLMTFAVKMLGGMDQSTLIQGGIAIAAFVGVLVGLMAATKLISGSKNVETVGSTLLKIALAIGVMGLVVKMLGGMDQAALIQGGIAIVAFSGIIVGLMAATKLITGSKNIDAIGGTLLKIALAIGIMGLVVRVLGGMKREELIQGTLAITAFAGIIVGLMAATKLISGSTNVDKIGKSLFAISGAIAIMALTAFMLSMISWEGFAKGTAMITIFGGIIVALMAATRLLTGSKNVDKIGNTLLAVAGAIGILALIAVLLGLVPVENLKRGVAAVSVLSLVMMGLIAVTKLAKNSMGNIISITVAIAIIAASAYLLSTVNPDNLKGATLAMMGLLTIFGLVIASTKFAKKSIGTLIAISAAIAIIGSVLYLLSTMPAESTIASAKALGGLLIVMTGVLAALGFIGKMAKNALMGVLALAAMAVPLAAFVGVLALMQDVQNAAANVKALSMLATAMTMLLIPLTIIGAFGSTGAPYLGALALLAMAVPLVAFVGVLALMQNVQNATNNALALTTLATAMTALLIPLTVVGAFGVTGAPYLGVLALLAMAVPLVAFVGILALMQNIQNAEANVTLLTSLMITMTKILAVLSIIAPFAMVGVTALASLTTLMVGIGLLAVAIGALMEKFPAIQSFLDTGIPVLEQLANGIGSIIGNFVGGFMGGIAESLPEIGTKLSEFMTNVTPFIDGAKNIDESVIKGVGYLSAAIMALTAAELLNGLVEFFPFTSSLAQLGTDLSTFMANAQGFITGAAAIDPAVMDGVKTIAETILLLTAANVVEGLTSWFTGGSSLENFAAQLGVLGSGLNSFITNIGTFSEEQAATVTCAANAIKTLAQASSEIPNTGGLLAQIVGDNDLSVFAAQFPILGSGLASFLSNIGTFTDEQVATVNCAASAIKTLAQASSEIPNTGGLLGQLVGENDLGVFASQFPILGAGLASFLSNVGTFTDEQVATVDCAAKAIKTLAEASSEIPNTGGWLGQIVGENDLGTFADQFPKLGTGLASFLSNLGTFTDDQVATVNCAANAIKVLAQASAAIPNAGGWLASLIGDNELGTFASQLPNVGSGIKGFCDNLGTFDDSKVATVNAAVRAIDALSGLANTNLDGFNDDVSGFGKKIVKLAKKVSEFCSEMSKVSTSSMDSAVSNIKKIANAIKSLEGVDGSAAENFSNALKKLGKSGVDKFVKEFTSSAAKTNVKEAATKLADQVIKGIESKENGIKTAGTDAAKKAVEGAGTQDDEMESAGKDLGSGLVKGINAKQTAVYNAGFALGQKAVQGEKDGQASNSPSKLTIQAGNWLGDGLIIGMKQMGDKVYSAGHNLGKTATGTISSAISKVADMVNTDIDAQPTIRPVLDLSDVRNGVGSINNMLGMGASVGVMANVNGISSMMNQRSQNGVNGDVVSAINKLSKKMDNSPRNSYSISGINVSEGTDAADAIHTLVRAITMEGRS